MKNITKKIIVAALAVGVACAGEAGAGGSLVGRMAGKVVAKEVAEQGAKVAVKKGMSSALEQAAKTVAKSALAPKTVMATGVATGTALVGVGAKHGLETEAESDRIKAQAAAEASASRMETAREIAGANPKAAAEFLSATAPTEAKSFWGRIGSAIGVAVVVLLLAVGVIAGIFLLGFGKRAWSYFRMSNVRSLEELRIS